MSRPIRIECVNCEGVATLEHDATHHYYVIKFCPFCGEELELEEGYEPNEDFEQEYQADN
tara:strand:- start:1 stop:180 length:180 start_codon:yes stop_codon:yes gene_type:complete